MQKSSRKSLRPSPSLDKSNVAAPAGQPVPAQPVADVPPAQASKPPLSLPLGGGYKVMLEGRFFFLIIGSIVLYIFAAFIANEWMYLLASGFFVALVLGFCFPFFQLVDVDAFCSMPDEVLVSECADVKIGLRRTMRLGPISAVIPLKSVRLSIEFIRRTATIKGEMILPPEPVLVEHIYGECWYEFPTAALRRGVYYLKHIDLLSCFPFGLTWWWRRISVKKQGVDQKVTVHPLVMPMSGHFLHRIGGVTSIMGISSASSIVTTQSTYVRSVREFKSGDSLRHIHWASTARVGKLLVREFDSEVLPVFDLLLDLTANWRNQEQFELAVLLSHSLVHLGYGMGKLPDLILHPAVDSKQVQSLMSDLPQMPLSLTWISEVLSRVEPLNLSDVPREERGASSGADVAQLLATASGHPLLSILPASEGVMKSSPTRRDHVVYPIKLVLVDNQPYIKEESKTKSAPNYVSMSAILTQATILAELDGEAEIEAI